MTQVKFIRVLFAMVLMMGSAQATLLVSDEFNSSADGDAVNGIYDSGADLGDSSNATVSGGSIIGYDNTTSWSDSSYIESYANLVRVLATQYGWTYSGRALTTSMTGKTEAYGKVVMRQNLATASLASGQMHVGFGSSDSLGSLGGALIGYMWDGANWDMTLRYRDTGGFVVSAVIIDNAGSATQDVYWKMDDTANTIKVWVDNNDAGTAADLTVTDWGATVADISHVTFGEYETGLSSTNFVYVYDIHLSDIAEDIGMIPEPPPAGLLFRDEFNSSTDGDAVSGIYDSGADLGDVSNATVSGGTIIGYDNTTAWTDSSYIESYANLVRVLATQYSWTYSGREITTSMVGKTEAYGKVVMRQSLASASASTGQMHVGFGSSDSLGSLGGAHIGYMWDGSNWDMTLRYRNTGGSVVSAVIVDNATNITQEIYWKMDDVANTINVWVDNNDYSTAGNLTVTDWGATVAEISHVTFGNNETGLSSADFVYVYDIRLGETPESIGMELPPTTAYAEILSIEPFSSTVMKLVVSADNPFLCYPKSSAGLLLNTWDSVGHSTNGAAPFVVTNLDYSAASGADFVVYIEADQDKKFIKIGAE